jgi:hypothetical protein
MTAIARRGSRSLGRHSKKAGLGQVLAQVLCTPPSPILQPRIGSANVDGKAWLILLSEMMAYPFGQCTSTMLAEVVIEVSEVRHE